jgi:hypothetical protein
MNNHFQDFSNEPKIIQFGQSLLFQTLAQRFKILNA